ncbi:MAG TPA: DinB family protein [Acidimicrobiales bacterium]|nr:DinB family protein [Acidimicrobiales bacterium]
MHIRDIFLDGFGRIKEGVPRTIEGLSVEELALRPDKEANSIGWLVWHLARVQDDHIAGAAGLDQVWFKAGWAKRLDLGLAPEDTGYGHRPTDVERVRASGEELAAYHEEVSAQTLKFLEDLGDQDFDRVVDERWDPPVTLGVRLVSVLEDDAQHLGQAAYLRGLIERRRAGA